MTDITITREGSSGLARLAVEDGQLFPTIRPIRRLGGYLIRTDSLKLLTFCGVRA
jgi:hypothetical protein